MSSKFVKRRLFNRVVIWDTKGGTILDLPSRYVLSGASPSISEEYVDLANGSQVPVRRTSEVQVPITANELDVLAEVIQRSKCPVKAAFIGQEGTDSFLWLEPTRLQVRDPQVETGLQAQKVLELKSKVFYPGIWESEDLVGGIPWQGTEGVVFEDIEGSPTRLEPKGEPRFGYRGPGWEVSSESDSVDLKGEAQLSSDAKLDFDFPVWGATLTIDTIVGFSLGNIVVNALNFNKSVIKTVTAQDDTEFVIPEKTWSIEISVSSSTARPKVRVKNTNVKRPAIAYVGKVSPDCQKVDDPDFIKIPQPNNPPQWENKDNLVWGKENTAPTFTKCEDYTTTDNNTGGDNSPPQFTSCNNYTTLETNTGTLPGSGYTPPSTIQSTSAIYTSDGGFAKIDWPGLTRTNIKDNPADGELAIDENAGYVFVATNSGIKRYDLSGGNETNIVGTDPDGVAVDQLTQTLYYTSQAVTGIWTSDYSGNNNSKIADPPGISNSIAVAPDGGKGGFIFVASFDVQEIYRLDLSGINKKTIADYTNRNATTYSNVHLHLEEALVFWQDSPKDTQRRIRRANFNGTNEFGIFLQSSSVNIFDIYEWTILQDENKWVQIEREENAFSRVRTRNLDGSGLQTDSINDLDSGSYLHPAQKMSN